MASEGSLADRWHQQQPGGKDTLLDKFLRLHQLNFNVCVYSASMLLAQTVLLHQCPEATALFSTLVEYLWKVCSLLPGKIGLVPLLSITTLLPSTCGVKLMRRLC